MSTVLVGGGMAAALGGHADVSPPGAAVLHTVAMKIPRAIHRWSLTPQQAIRLQRRLAAMVRQTPLRRSPRLIAGGDATIDPTGAWMIAGWVVWDGQTRAVVESVVAVRPVRFPYVPGLLSFREAPALIAAARKLRREPEVFMLDGQGLAHPRRFGLACHVGVLLDRPSLGCAKSLLCGTPEPAVTNHQHPKRSTQHSALIPPADTVPEEAGAWCPLVDRGKVIGRVLRTRAGVKPVYVSVGHRLTLDEAAAVAWRCCSGYRLPEPARLAHQLVGRHRDSPS
jgi:deoxyribonuclease V